MEVVKAQLLTTVIATQVSALTYGKVPYFPIEVSRTAASGRIPMGVFRCGILSLIITLLVSNTLDWQTFTVWLSLSLICCADDVNHWFLHMTGVFSLILVAAYSIYERGEAALIPFVVAIMLYLVRLLVKFLVITFYEIWEERSLSMRFLRLNIEHHMNIMYEGAKVCKRPDIVIPVFKASGVLQWALLYSLSRCF